MRHEMAVGAQQSTRTTQRWAGSEAMYDANFQCAFKHLADHMSTCGMTQVPLLPDKVVPVA